MSLSDVRKKGFLRNSQSVHRHSDIIRIQISKTASSVQNELDTMGFVLNADYFGYVYHGCAITTQNAR